MKNPLVTITPFPGTKFFENLDKDGRILHYKWEEYDTRHAVFQPALMLPEDLEEGYRWSYEKFYSYTSILERSFGMTAPTKRLLYI
ncbi:MAG TPA: DUF4070 domain-containing protein [Candidatus Eremiobacteraeota bacterium]|nr:MAG: hypothetical protein BWY64_01972 [bacterium ADurb.Bin363]HPZ07700.1 DUF4070 domain-containing protein [Candidatus Eremiobacteraeota bacterium]